MLRPLDILLALKVAAGSDLSNQYGFDAVAEKPPNSPAPTFAALGQGIGVSASQAYNAAKSAIECGLLRPDFSIKPRALMQVLSTIEYYIPAHLGAPARGIATSYASEPLMGAFVYDPSQVPVWPDPQGNVFGLSVAPLYKTAPAAAKQDVRLYRYLALVDALRVGRAREKELAINELKTLLGQNG